MQRQCLFKDFKAALLNHFHINTDWNYQCNAEVARVFIFPGVYEAFWALPTHFGFMQANRPAQ